jgi:hypothetical protein
MLVHLRYIRSDHLGRRDVARLQRAGASINNQCGSQSGFKVEMRVSCVESETKDCHSKKRALTLQKIIGALGKLETFIRNTKMNGKTTSRFTLDYFPRNRAWKGKSWKGSWRMWRFDEHKEHVVCRSPRNPPRWNGEVPRSGSPGLAEKWSGRKKQMQ